MKKQLGLLDLVIYGLCMISPLCLYLVYGSVAQASYGMVPLVYLIGTLLMLFTALSYNQFAKEVSTAGSLYGYIAKGINPHVGFVSGWLILGYYFAVPAFTYSLSAVWLENLFPLVPAFVWVAFLAIFNTVVNARGLEMGVKINYVLFGIQLVSLLIFMGLGIKFVFIDGHGVGGFSLEPFFQAEHFDWKFIATSVSIAVVGFLGLDGISTFSEEAKNPKKHIGLAMICTLLGIGFIYIAQGYLTTLIHPDASNLDPDMGLFDISREIGGNGFFAWMIIINVVAFGIACAGGLQTALARILFAMSRDKLFPGFLSKVHPKYNTPINAVIFTGGISFVLGVFAPTSIVLLFLNFGAVSAYLILNIAVIIYFYFRLKRRGFKNTFNCLVFPLMGVLACGFAWSGFDKLTYIAGFTWIAIGVIIGAVVSKGYKITPKIDDL